MLCGKKSVYDGASLEHQEQTDGIGFIEELVNALFISFFCQVFKIWIQKYLDLDNISFLSPSVKIDKDRQVIILDEEHEVSTFSLVIITQFLLLSMKNVTLSCLKILIKLKSLC